MDFSVTTNFDDIARTLDDVARTQVPFATALALTRTAQDIQGHLQGTLSDYFTTRGRWVERSIRIDKATKATLTSRVGTLYEPMRAQAEGGTKDGKGGGSVAVPIAARADESQKTAPSKWPGKLAQKRDFFLAPFGNGVVGAASDGSSGVGLFQRIGRRREKKRLKLWWLIEDEVKIEPRWPFEQLARETVEREVVTNFWSAMETALATAKPRYSANASRASEMAASASRVGAMLGL
jgi:hypothetical protein